MPLTTLHLVALSPDRTIRQYLQALKSQSIKPLVTSKVIRWIIKPEKLSTHLLLQPWDLLLILPATTHLPAPLSHPDWIRHHWSITAGVPSSLLTTDDFPSRNHHLLYPPPSAIPPLETQSNPLIASSSQALELSAELLNWSKTYPASPSSSSSSSCPSSRTTHHPVSMLNLLSFHPTKDAHASYLKYGKAFAESIGSKRGGNAKIVGRVVVPDQRTAEDEDGYGWDEVALAQYPSIAHFVHMLGSEDYQSVNRRYRVPALRDTLILCTSEVDGEVLGGWDDEAGGGGGSGNGNGSGSGAKL